MIKIGTLNFAYVDGEDIGVLTSDFKVDIDDTTYIVPEGEQWDGASIPPRAWGILKAHPFDKYHRRPSCYHDRAYTGAFCESKIRADYNYMRLLIAEHYPIHKAVVEFLALTFFGKSHWRGDSASRRAAKDAAKDLAVLALAASLLALCSGCAAIDAIPTEWKAAGLSAAWNVAVEFFTGD